MPARRNTRERRHIIAEVSIYINSAPEDLGRLDRIEQKLDLILKKENTMADTLQNESDALTTEETTVSAVVADVAAEITKFQTAAAAGVDTTPFVTRINAINTTLQGLDQSALSAAGTLPVALPPASPAPTPAS